MKHAVFLSTILAVAACGLPAMAQTPAPGPTPNAAMRQQFRQMRTQMQQIHSAERSQMLQALTPSHRQLLASIAGQLATSATPDYRAAVQRLDGALTSSEKQAILAAAQSARSKQRSLFESMRSQFEQSHPNMHVRRMEPSSGMHRHAPDAGAMLLRTMTGGSNFGPRFGPPRPPR
jgi:hypothetical protein